MFISALWLVICAMLAFSLSAVCGGGAGLLLIPLLKTILPAANVPATLSIGTAASSVSRMAVFKSHIQWKIVAWFVPAALPAVWLGAWLLKYLNPLYLELILGLFLVGNLPMLFKSKKESIAQRPLPVFYLSLIGAAAGFVSGLTGAVGLLFNRFYLRYGLTKEQILATRAANELLLHLIKIFLYASFGLLTHDVFLLGILIGGAAIGSSWAMKWLLPKINDNWFKRLGYGAMIISGISLLTGATNRLIDTNHTQISLTPLSDGVQTQVQWKEGTFTLEFEYEEGIEFETKINFEDLPASQRVVASRLSKEADKVLIEEVFGVNKHYYEVYVFTNGKVVKTDI
ncbi:sulfite exporter TauE/SafE family protein [Xanthocytophaga agilis]|uniref:Probable membrane transporter protein n=1 Tax=Xanthocytophaga agilis TaxID=3048010 RepID=A0AAE3UHV5_9BACT|nr:sulfite exporter TauE/SafE family protein [Xanthocytophaga agilis]MDJ1503013.1 sulfite exporter TauE/SafE family protein [Xanthocytophaga agilis]